MKDKTKILRRLTLLSNSHMWNQDEARGTVAFRSGQLTPVTSTSPLFRFLIYAQHHIVSFTHSAPFDQVP